jgi:hypothetical protein
MNNLNINNYKKLTAKLVEMDRNYSLRLKTGNCGVFAIALQKYLGYGELVEMSYFAHVLLKIDNDLFLDGTGIWTAKKLQYDQLWGEYYEEYGLRLTTEEKVLNGTAIWRKPIHIDEMKNIIITNAKQPIVI